MMNTADQYRREWAAKTGRPASEVYVPEALRKFRPVAGGSVRSDSGPGVITEITVAGLLHVDWSDGRETAEFPSAFDASGALREPTLEELRRALTGGSA